MRKLKLFVACLLMAVLSIGQVWAADDVINNAATSTNCSGTATNSWVTDFSITGASGAEYRIHTMGTKNTSNALQWNTNGFMNQTKSGGTLKSVTINGTNGKSVKIYAGNSAYSTSKPSGTALATLNLTGSPVTYTFENNYTYLALVGGASSTQIVSITIEYQSGVPTLESLSIDGDLSNKSYQEGQELDYSGLTVTGTYSDSNTGDVTADVEWSFSPELAAGTTSYTVTAAIGDISANKIINNVTVTEHVVTPGEYTINLTNTLFGTTADATITAATSAKQNDITLTINGSGTKPRTDASYVRFYNNSTLNLTVPEGYNITKVVITANQSDYSAPSVNVGEFDASTKTWTGKANEVVWSFSAKSFIGQIKVTYAESCDELAAINGSVNLDQTTATLTWDAIQGVTAWSVSGNVKDGDAIASDNIGAITAINEDAQKQCVISNLTSSTAYEFQIHATTISTGYCSNVNVWSLEGSTEANYTITEATNNSNYGTVTRSGNVITGAPADYCQYASTAYTVSPANSAEVAQDGNTFTVTPTANTTVTINFEPIPVTSVTLDVTSAELEVGGTITLTAEVAPNTVNPNVTWQSSNTNVATVEDGEVTAVAVGTATITATSVGDNNKSASCTVTVTAATEYTKVTAAPTDWSGEYLLVYENSEIEAFVWTGVDAASCYATATISNNKITKPASAVKLTLAALTGDYEGKYSILINGGTNNGKYLANSSTKNEFVFEESASAFELGFNSTSGELEIANNSKTIRYNSTNTAQSVQLRFRPYGSGQNAVQLYKKVSTDPEVTATPNALEFTAKQNIAVEGKKFTLTGANLTSGLTLAATTGFSVSPAEITAEAAMAQGGVEVTVTPATPTSATSPVEGTVTISGGDLASNVVVNLSMAVTETYAVSVAVNDGNMGSATINGGAGPVYAEYAEEVNLIATPVEGHEFVSWAASSDDIEIANATSATTTAAIGAAGTITATFQAQACKNPKAPTLNGAVAVTYNSATINWNAVTQDTNDDAIAEDGIEGYLLNITKHEDGSAVLKDEMIENALTFTKNVLLANTQYDFTLMAYGDDQSYCLTSNPTLAGSFTTSDYPASTLSLQENGGEAYAWGSNLKMNDVIALPTELAGLGCSGKVLAGWSSVAVAETDEEPTSNYWAKGANYTLGAGAQTLYAVLATMGEGHTYNNTYNLESSDAVWVAENCTTYFSQPYGMKKKDAQIINNSISDFNSYANVASSIEIKVKCLQNAGTGSRLTVYLVNAEGNAIDGTGKEITPDNASAATSTTNQTVSYTSSEVKDKNAKGYMIKCTTFDKNVLVNGTSYSITTAGSYSAFTTTCTAAQPQVATPTFSLTEGSFTEGQSVELSCTTEDATIYYVINQESITAENRQTYTSGTPIQLSARGEYTIQAIAVKADFDDSEVATATYTINPAFASVYELFKYLTENNLTTLSNVVVTGIVSEIVTAYNSTYENVSYNIVDINNEGAISSDPLQCFRGLGVKGEGDNYTDADAVAIGDRVTVTGNYKVHTDGTKELDKDNYIITRIPATMSGIEIGGVLENTTYHLNDEISYEGLSVNAVYSTGLKIATEEEVAWSYSPEDAMTVAGEDKEVTITGKIGTGENEISATKTVTITVLAKQDPQLAFAETSFVVLPSSEFTAPELTTATGFDGTVTYSTESNLVTVDETTGEVTIGATGGTAIIKASSAETTTFSAGEASYSIVIDSRKRVSNTSAFTAVSGDLNNEISYASYKGDGTGDPIIKNSAIQIYQINNGKTSGGYITVTAVSGCKIDQVKITTKTNATTVAYSKDGGSLSENSDVESGADYLTDAGLNAQSVNIYCMSTSSSNRLFVASMTVYYTGEAVDELSSIELSGEYATEFNVGEEFNHNGLVVTAHYTVSEDAIVTNDAVVSTPDMSIRGQRTVTVSYTEGDVTKTASYQITVNSTETITDEPVVLIAKRDNKYYAIAKTIDNNTFKAIPVTYSQGLVTVNSEAASEDIIWYMSDVTDGVTFATAVTGTQGVKFMSGTSGGTDMSLASTACTWTWNSTDNAYEVGSRTPLYNGTGFKNFAASNIGTGTYSTALQYLPASSIRVQAVEISTPVTEAAIAAEADVVVHEGGYVTIENDVTWSNLTVEPGSVIDLSAGSGTITTTDFVIQATNTTSNQVIGATNGNESNIQAENIYFEKDFVHAGHHWYNVAVPFPVDINGGIQKANGEVLEWDTHFNFYKYNGQTRYENGKNGSAWEEVGDPGNAEQQLLPGVNYQCVFDQAYGTIRFKKAAGENINNGANITANSYGIDTDPTSANAGWNGIANNGLTYAQAIMLDLSYIQVLNAAGTAYEPQILNGFVLIVGMPFFVQGAGTFNFMNANDVTDPLYAAPQRSNGIADPISVELRQNGQRVDRLYVTASEDASSNYEMGKDVAKFISNSTAQLWVNNYNEKLCANDAPLVNDQAIYDLGIYASTAGTYSLSAAAIEGADLYVTYGGQIVWNLSLGDYEMDLVRGTTTGYGLLLVAQPNQMPTGVENGELLNGENGVQKILLNGQLYILRDGHLYDAVGKEMK